MAVFSMATDTGAEVYFSIKRCGSYDEKASLSSEWLHKLAGMAERNNGRQFLFSDGSCLTVFMGGRRGKIIEDVRTVFAYGI